MNLEIKAIGDGLYESGSLEGLYVVFTRQKRLPILVLNNGPSAPFVFDHMPQSRAERVEGHIGTYRSRELGVELEILAQAGALALKRGDEVVKLLAGRSNQFFAPDRGISLEFDPVTRSSHGGAHSMRLYMKGLRAVPFERQAAATPAAASSRAH